MLDCPTQMLSLLLCLVSLQSFFFVGCPSRNQDLGVRVLNVGEELHKQILPLKMGQGIYKIQGLKESRWYEVKISYPASIPSRFSLQVNSDAEGLWLNMNRRLLNTEKIIFMPKLVSGDNGMFVLVTVEPDGIVAKPLVQEREFVFFNIVCDELAFGIPHKAWWVCAAAILCLILASVVPCFFPLEKLLKIQAFQSSYSAETKAS